MQIAARLEAAPLAYVLSAVAAAIYVVLAITIARPERTARRVAVVACAIELGGVLAVGVASLTRPEAFTDETVWSRFGAGYGFVPLVLPVLGLLWLRRPADR